MPTLFEDVLNKIKDQHAILPENPLKTEIAKLLDEVSRYREPNNECANASPYISLAKKIKGICNKNISNFSPFFYTILYTLATLIFTWGCRVARHNKEVRAEDSYECFMSIRKLINAPFSLYSELTHNMFEALRTTRECYKLLEEATINNHVGARDRFIRYLIDGAADYGIEKDEMTAKIYDPILEFLPRPGPAI